jgi:hypothetical protein
VLLDDILFDEIVSGVDIDDLGDLRHITAPRFHFSSIKMHGSFSITFVHAVHRDAFRFCGPWKGKAVIIKSCMNVRDYIYYTQVASRSFIRPGAGVSSSSNEETIVGFCLRTLTTHLNRVDGLQSGVLSTESVHGSMAGMTCLWMAATVILHIYVQERLLRRMVLVPFSGTLQSSMPSCPRPSIWSMHPPTRMGGRHVQQR